MLKQLNQFVKRSSLIILLLVLVLCFCLRSLAGPVLRDVIEIELPPDATHNIGLYYLSKQRSERKTKISEQELLIKIVQPGEVHREYAMPTSSFVLRSSDLVHRLRLDIGRPNLDKERPYRIGFESLSFDDRDGNSLLELQHSATDFIWLDPYMLDEHFAPPMSTFTLRDKHGKVFCSVTILGPASEVEVREERELIMQQQLEHEPVEDVDSLLITGESRKSNAATTQPASHNMLGL